MQYTTPAHINIIVFYSECILLVYNSFKCQKPIPNNNKSLYSSISFFSFQNASVIKSAKSN